MRWINAQSGEDVLEQARRIGDYLLDQVYAGDPSRLRLHARKPASLRRIAKHPALTVSASTIWRSLALARQCRILAPDVAERLSLAQHRVLLRVQDPSRLARRAIDEAMDVATLEDWVRRLPEVRERRGGRPAAPPGSLAIRRTVRALEAARRLAARAAPSPDEREAFAELRRAWTATDAWWSRRLSAAEGGVS